MKVWLPIIMGLWAAAHGSAQGMPPNADGPAAGAAAGATSGVAAAFACDFDNAWDPDFDGWPNAWSRRRDRGYPHYLSIKLQDGGPPGGGRALRIELDGGAAQASSPPIPVDPLFEYLLEVQASVGGLKHDRAFVSLTAMDAHGQPLRRWTSPPVAGTAPWQALRVGPLAITAPEARFAVVALHVEPTALADLTGTACFGGVRLWRLPRVELQADQPQGVYLAPANVEVRCRVSGALTAPIVSLQVEDIWGKAIGRHEAAVAVEASAPAAPAEAEDDAATDSPAKPLVAWQPAAALPPARRGSVIWRAEIAAPGFYRVRATLQGQAGQARGAATSLAVVTPREPSGRGEFGWSLPQGEDPLSGAALARLLAAAGVHWVKLPVWADADAEPSELAQAASLADRLNDRGIATVGMLAVPPRKLRAQLRNAAPTAAEAFTLDPKLWTPTLETTLAALGMRVRCWQLGGDRDASFSTLGNADETLAAVRAAFDRLTADAHLALAWNWSQPLPTPGPEPAPYQALALWADPSPNDRELAALLGAAHDAPWQRWVSLQPLPREAHPLDARAGDLVRRMVAAKAQRADAIFCADPFDPQTGLMNPDGTPGELFLPWRTTALCLAGAKHVGSLTLPGGSRAEVFADDRNGAIVLDSETPIVEPFDAGPGAQRLDVWGRPNPVGETIEVGPLPVFLVGLSAPLVRWQMGVQFAADKLPSVVGRPHATVLRAANEFPRAVSGRATIVAPDGWRVEPRQFNFHLAAGEPLAQPLQIILPPSAAAGRQQLQVDFELQADVPHRFRVFRFIEVGLGDLAITVSSRLDDRGQLEVAQRLINNSDSAVSVRCQLNVPGRRPLKSQVLQLGQGADLKVYRLPDGRELLGQTLWLRAEEINGPRTLNYRFVAGQ